jgi:hypothetical protein
MRKVVIKKAYCGCTVGRLNRASPSHRRVTQHPLLRAPWSRDRPLPICTSALRRRPDDAVVPASKALVQHRMHVMAECGEPRCGDAGRFSSSSSLHATSTH